MILERKYVIQCLRESIFCIAVHPGWVFPAVCWWIQGCRFLAPEVWSWATAWKHQPSTPAAVWAARGAGLHHQKHGHVLFLPIKNEFCFPEWFSKMISADRGNDNWLLKYDCPMDSATNRVRVHTGLGKCLSLFALMNSIILTSVGHRLGASEESHHQTGSNRQWSGIPSKTSGLLESL